MSKTVKDVIHAKDIDISIYTNDFQNEYISLTDIARFKSDEPSAVIQNWMRSRDVIEFLGLWESLNNPNFNPIEFEGFKNEAGANAFTMSPEKWIEGVNAVGIVSKFGRQRFFLGLPILFYRFNMFYFRKIFRFFLNFPS